MEARNRTLPEWFNRIRSGQLRLPRFQRFEAWTHQEVSGLLESVVKGLPTGAALILEVGDAEPFVSRAISRAPEPVDRVTEHLLDGQQRLTALWRSLHDFYDDRSYFVRLGPDDDAEASLVTSHARWNKDGARYPRWADEPEQILARGLIPLKLLRPGDVAAEVNAWCVAAVGMSDMQKLLTLSSRITELRAQVSSFNLPFLSLPVGTKKEVALDVFIKMNTSSVALSPFDIVVAEVEDALGKSLHDLVAGIKKEVPGSDNYIPLQQWILSTAALLQGMPPTLASYHRLEFGQIVHDWPDIVAGIRYTIDLLEEQRIYDEQRLPTNVVLPVVAALFRCVPAALDGRGRAKTVINRYLWKSFCTRRYENSAATRSFQDYKGLRAMISEGADWAEVPVFHQEEYPVPSVEELKVAGWPKPKDILARGILAAALRKGARDLADDSTVTRERLPKREYHHLFPDSLLKDDGGYHHKRERFRALNCALITWSTNRNISAKEPLKYLRERIEGSLVGEAEIKERLLTHLVPFAELNVGGFADIADVAARHAEIQQRYEAFLNARAAMVREELVRLCSISVPTEEELPVAVTIA